MLAALREGRPRAAHIVFRSERVADRQRRDRIIPDWLGWLAVSVALILATVLAYFKFS